MSTEDVPLPEGWTIDFRTEAIPVRPGEPGYSHQYQAFRPGDTTATVTRADGRWFHLTDEERTQVYLVGYGRATTAIVERVRDLP